jgi:hypothetical protein
MVCDHCCNVDTNSGGAECDGRQRSEVGVYGELEFVEVVEMGAVTVMVKEISTAVKDTALAAIISVKVVLPALLK